MMQNKFIILPGNTAIIERNMLDENKLCANVRGGNNATCYIVPICNYMLFETRTSSRAILIKIFKSIYGNIIFNDNRSRCNFLCCSACFIEVNNNKCDHDNLLICIHPHDFNRLCADTLLAFSTQKSIWGWGWDWNKL